MLKFIKGEVRLGKFSPRKALPVRLTPLGQFECKKIIQAMDLGH